MNAPIQSAPIDRASRAVTIAATAKEQGLSPQQFNFCELCDLLPPPLNMICSRVCPIIR